MKGKPTRFRATLELAGKTATGFVIPDGVVEALGQGKRPPVVVTINGYSYRNTVAVMRGRYLISVSSAIREETGLKGGDEIRVKLALADGPRPVEAPLELKAALDAQPAARVFFQTLSNSLQRYHIDNIKGAKTPETRQRRVDKAVSLFLAGKKR